MKPADKSTASSAADSTARYRRFDVIAKSILVALAVAGVIGASGYLSGYDLLGLNRSGDSVSQSDAHAREVAFASAGVLALSAVPAAEIPSAVSHMGLAKAGEAAMLANLAVSETPSSIPAAAPPPDTIAQPAARRDPLRLAWITLWDTDAEDGDVVRIDSDGYSRTITLAKQPLTIAIPVPRNSILKVTGIRDGEGGGITVGLASGGVRVVFPIMSEGQTLGLNVHLN
jgi:hypothetical protein